MRTDVGRHCGPGAVDPSWAWLPGKAWAPPACSRTYPDPAPPRPRVVLPCWQPVPPAPGDAYVCAGLSQCPPPLPSSVWSPNPPLLPLQLTAPAGASLCPGFRHRGRVQFLPAWLPRKDLITCPLSLWGSGGSTAVSPGAAPVAGTRSQCHTQGEAASCEHGGDVSGSGAKPPP